MNASEARDLTKLKSVENIEKRVEEVFVSIGKAIRNGEFKCYFYKNMHEAVITFFQDKGYQVQLKDGGRNESYYEIKW